MCFPVWVQAQVHTLEWAPAPTHTHTHAHTSVCGPKHTHALVHIHRGTYYTQTYAHLYTHARAHRQVKKSFSLTTPE